MDFRDLKGLENRGETRTFQTICEIHLERLKRRSEFEEDRGLDMRNTRFFDVMIALFNLTDYWNRIAGLVSLSYSILVPFG